MNLFDFYTLQSNITTLGKYKSLIDDFSYDIATLCEITKGLILHYADENIFQYPIPKHRFQEMDTRYVEKILQTILSLDNAPLNIARVPSKRIIGICRDNSVLICSILRSKNIPSRLRMGFVDYFIPGIYLDGVAVEYWNSQKAKWCLVDTRTSQSHIDKLGSYPNLDLHDLTEERFVSSAKAWKLCRTNLINPNRFGSRTHRGLWYVRNRLLNDFAYLNKKEGLIWDVWGMMIHEDENLPTVPDSQLETLDQLSDFILNNTYNINAINNYYQSHPILQVPNVMQVYNPFCKPSVIEIED